MDSTTLTIQMKLEKWTEKIRHRNESGLTISKCGVKRMQLMKANIITGSSACVKQPVIPCLKLLGPLVLLFRLHYEKHLFLFCGRRKDRIKALYWQDDGFLLLYKRLENGSFQWPNDPEEVKSITKQELRWLLEGLSINQPKAVKKVHTKASV